MAPFHYRWLGLSGDLAGSVLQGYKHKAFTDETDPTSHACLHCPFNHMVALHNLPAGRSLFTHYTIFPLASTAAPINVISSAPISMFRMIAQSGSVAPSVSGPLHCQTIFGSSSSSFHNEGLFPFKTCIPWATTPSSVTLTLRAPLTIFPCRAQGGLCSSAARLSPAALHPITWNLQSQWPCPPMLCAGRSQADVSYLPFRFPFHLVVTVGVL